MAALVPLVGVALATAFTRPTPVADGVAFCGPRCIYQVLRHFGKDVELTDLIVEMAGPDLRGQSSLAELAEALERHGISTKLVSLPLLDVPAWPDPIIVHVDGNHFLVLEKAGPFAVTVKDGPWPAADMSLWELKRRASGPMLLTADRPIGEEPYSRAEWRYAVLILGVSLVLIGAWPTIRRWPQWKSAALRPVALGVVNDSAAQTVVQ